MSDVLIFDADNFDRDVLQFHGVTLVDFWAAWCGPCHAMVPVMKELANEYRVGKVNFDENESLGQQYEIQVLPTFIIFKDGEIVDRLLGVKRPQAFKERLKVWSG